MVELTDADGLDTGIRMRRQVGGGLLRGDVGVRAPKYSRTGVAGVFSSSPFSPSRSRNQCGRSCECAVRNDSVSRSWGSAGSAATVASPSCSPSKSADAPSIHSGRSTSAIDSP